MFEPLHHLVQAARQNNQSAWDQLFKRYPAVPFRLCPRPYRRPRGGVRHRAGVVRGAPPPTSGGCATTPNLDRGSLRHRASAVHAALPADAPGGMSCLRTIPTSGDHEGGDPDPRDALLSAERADAPSMPRWSTGSRCPSAPRSSSTFSATSRSQGDRGDRRGPPSGTVKSRLHHAKPGDAQPVDRGGATMRKNAS